MQKKTVAIMTSVFCVILSLSFDFYETVLVSRVLVRPPRHRHKTEIVISDAVDFVGYPFAIFIAVHLYFVAFVKVVAILVHSDVPLYSCGVYLDKSRASVAQIAQIPPLFWARGRVSEYVLDIVAIHGASVFERFSATKRQ